MELKILTHPSFEQKGVYFGVVDALFPEKEAWDLPAFEELKERELKELRLEMEGYERAAVFGGNPYNRYFKKYKKTYPVLQQLESWLLKGRPFPGDIPINEVTFLTELKTRMLLGTHDIDRMLGEVELFCPEEKLDFPGILGETVHCYPGDVTGRDDGGIILSMIAGADDRTCLHKDSRHISFLFFGAPGVSKEEIRAVQERLVSYARVLAPQTAMKTLIL